MFAVFYIQRTSERTSSPGRPGELARGLLED